MSSRWLSVEETAELNCADQATRDVLIAKYVEVIRRQESRRDAWKKRKPSPAMLPGDACIPLHPCAVSPDISGSGGAHVVGFGCEPFKLADGVRCLTTADACA